MPSFIPSVTMDPHVRFPSSWKLARGAILTDSVIEQYEREGRYGSDRQAMRKRLDGIRVVNGVQKMPGVCLTCNNAEGYYMTYGYLPKSGRYCDHCRKTHKDATEKESHQRKWNRSLEAFE